jgi:hypothetical protein
MTARYIVGDVRAVLATLEPASVDLVLTSPPFLALRSYLPADHPDKPSEIGSEATPGAYIDTLLDVVEACARVLAPHGSMCFELGDTYAGSGGAGGDYNVGGLRDGQDRFDGSANRAYGVGAAPRPQRTLSTRPKYAGVANGDGRRSRPDDEAAGILQARNRPGPEGRDHVNGWPLDKSLCLIPEIFRFSLVYGFNPLTGRQTPRWRARNVIRWCRPNPPVGALGDKFRPATSDMVVLCKNRRRYFDLDAVRRPGSPNTHARLAKGVTSRPNTLKTSPDNKKETLAIIETDGAPPLDWWKISTQPYEGAHYATWPEQLCVTPIKAMSPARVCLVCGQPSERIVGDYILDAYRDSDRPQTRRAVALADAAGLTDEHISAVRAFGTSDAGKAQVINTGNGKNSEPVRRLAAEAKAVLGGYFREFVMSTNAAVGSEWSDCGHGSWRPGLVLDPFAGSGTTLQVATGHGRDAIGIDLDGRNADLALHRVGPLMLSVEDRRLVGGQPITRPELVVGPGAPDGKVIPDKHRYAEEPEATK